MSEWQDISTAPRDGTEIQLWIIDKGTEPGWVPIGAWVDEPYRGEGPCWCEWDIVDYDGVEGWSAVTATHWMPLPAPPGE